MIILTIVLLWILLSGLWFYRNKGNQNRKDRITDWIFIPPILLAAFLLSVFGFANDKTDRKK